MTKKHSTPTDRQANFIGPCGLLRRLASMLYDGLLVIAVLMVAAAVVVVPWGAEIQSGTFWFQAYLLLVWWFYFAVCWRLGGQTVGMKAWRIELVSGRGERIGWARTLLRFALAFVSGAVVGLGFLWSLFEPAKQCWHDLGSDSRLMVRPKNSENGQNGKNG